MGTRLFRRGWEVGVTTTREQLASATWPRFYIFYQEGAPHMAANRNVQDLLNATAFDSHNDKLGGVKEVFLDAKTGQPFFVEVGYGLFGISSSLVPLRGSHLEGEELHLAFVKDAIKDAPDVDVEQGITPEEQDRLLAHYHLTDTREGDRYATEVSPVGAGEPRAAAGAPPVTASGAAESTPRTAAEHPAPVTATADNSVVHSEERVNVEEETVPVERVSLHKDVVQDTETVSEDKAKEQIEDETDRSTK